MPVSFNGVDIVASLLDLEMRIGVLEKALDNALQGKGMSQGDIQKTRHQTFSEMKEKYPEADLHLTITPPEEAHNSQGNPDC